MIKRIIALQIILFSFFSCDYFEIKRKTDQEIGKGKVIARVYDAKLYDSDLSDMMPKNISKQDSMALAKSIINSWASQQIFLKKATENVSEVNNQEIEKLIDEYRKSLYINGYKEKLVKQQLDTVVTEQEVEDYFVNNKENFRVKLNQELVQVKYVYFDKDIKNKKEIIKIFKSDKEKDLEELEGYSINFRSSKLRDANWITVKQLQKLIPPLKKESKENLLKISKFIQKEDSLGVYLISISNVLKINNMAPISYISPSIKRLILHKRKLELVREIEKTLINDAIKNENFKEY